jgi:hypothetical protein
MYFSCPDSSCSQSRGWKWDVLKPFGSELIGSQLSDGYDHPTIKLYRSKANSKHGFEWALWYPSSMVARGTTKAQRQWNMTEVFKRCNRRIVLNFERPNWDWTRSLPLRYIWLCWRSKSVCNSVCAQLPITNQSRVTLVIHWAICRRTCYIHAKYIIPWIVAFQSSEGYCFSHLVIRWYAHLDSLVTSIWIVSATS